MTLIDFVFPKIPTLKTWLDKLLKNPVSEDPLTRNMILLKFASQHLYHLYWSLPMRLR